jgi:hypothetical protein
VWFDVTEVWLTYRERERHTHRERERDTHRERPTETREAERLGEREIREQVRSQSGALFFHPRHQSQQSSTRSSVGCCTGCGKAMLTTVGWKQGVYLKRERERERRKSAVVLHCGETDAFAMVSFLSVPLSSLTSLSLLRFFHCR